MTNKLFHLTAESGAFMSGLLLSLGELSRKATLLSEELDI